MVHFFTRSQSERIARPFIPRVCVPGRPPADDAEDASTFPNFPLNVAIVNTILNNSAAAGSIATSTWSGTLQFRDWSMRTCYPFTPPELGYQIGESTRSGPIGPNPPNPQIVASAGPPVVYYGILYSTFAKAKAATLTRWAYSVNDPNWQSYADGMPCYTWAAFKANVAAHPYPDPLCICNVMSQPYGAGGVFPAQPCLVDGIILPNGSFNDAKMRRREKGLDCEHQDGALYEDTLDLFQQLADIAHRNFYKWASYNNPLTQTGTPAYNWIGSPYELDEIAAHADWFNVFMFANPQGTTPVQSLMDQLARLPQTDPAKIQLQIDFNCTLADIREAAKRAYHIGLGGVDIFGANAGGDCSTNSVWIDKLAALTGYMGCTP